MLSEIIKGSAHWHVNWTFFLLVVTSNSFFAQTRRNLMPCFLLSFEFIEVFKIPLRVWTTIIQVASKTVFQVFGIFLKDLKVSIEISQGTLISSPAMGGGPSENFRKIFAKAFSKSTRKVSMFSLSTRNGYVR